MPTQGDIRVKDFTINENRFAIKKLIGYLPESAPLYHSMLVYDYLDYIANIRGLEGKHKHQRIRQMADLCGMQDIRRKIYQFYGIEIHFKFPPY